MAARLIGSQVTGPGQPLPVPAGTRQVRQGSYAGRRGWVYQHAGRGEWFFVTPEGPRGAHGWRTFTFVGATCPCGA